jgi:hypothetical protein
MTSGYVAEVVRRILVEYSLPDTVQRVGALSSSWEVTLENPNGVTKHLFIPSRTPQRFVEIVRTALAPPS